MNRKELIYQYDLIMSKILDIKHKSTPNKVAINSLNSFEKEIVNINKKDVLNCMAYNFYYWDKKNTLPKINQILSKSAFDRYKKSIHFDFDYIYKYLWNKYKIKIDFTKKDEENFFNIEDEYRKLAYKNMQGIAVCAENTSMYIKENKYCQSCINKNYCKTISKKAYKEIQIIRGNE